MWKRALLALILVSFGSLAGLKPASVLADANLVANAGLESSSGGQPDYWSTDSWGTNDASFTYLNEGHNSAHSARVVINQYTSGDAKWYFNPISVTPTTIYHWGDYYRSSVTTNVFVQYKDTNGNFTYQWLGAASSAADWQAETFDFTPPNGTANLTVFHVLSSVGQLDIDDELLNACQIPIVNGVPNGQLALTCFGAQIPAGWSTINTGQSSPSFQYLNTGYNDTNSVEIDMAGYVSGEAMWAFTPVAVMPNQRYQFNDYYRSNTYSYAYVLFTHKDGSTSTFSLISAPESGGEWTPYQDIFIAPLNAVTATVYHAMSSDGYLQTDDFSLTLLSNLGSNSFNRPIVSINFDDGDQSVYKNALPILNSYGYKSTDYIVTSFIDQPGSLTTKQLLALDQAGNDIESHTVTHPNLSDIPFSQAHLELVNSQTWLANLLHKPITGFASPYGVYNGPVLDDIKSIYAYHRVTTNQINDKYRFNPYLIQGTLVENTTTVAQLKAWLKSAKQQGGWLVLVYHIIGNSQDQYSVTKNQFKQELAAIKNSGIVVEPTNQALAEILPQTP